jgi:hypothetical protein
MKTTSLTSLGSVSSDGGGRPLLFLTLTDNGCSVCNYAIHHKLVGTSVQPKQSIYYDAPIGGQLFRKMLLPTFVAVSHANATNKQTTHHTDN